MNIVNIVRGILKILCKAIALFVCLLAVGLTVGPIVAPATIGYSCINDHSHQDIMMARK